MAATPERYLTLRQLSAATGIPVDALREGAARREFACVRLTRKGNYHARLSDVDRWLTTKVVPPVAPAKARGRAADVSDLIDHRDERLM